MIEMQIPGGAKLQIQHVALDFNGTVALDGLLLPGARERMKRLAELVTVHVLTADTHGTAAAECAGTGAVVETFPTGAAEPEKLAIVSALPGVYAVGNGLNDRAMCRAADLSCAVMGPEGVCTGLLSCVDVAVPTIEDALDLLLKPERLVATLRW